MPDAEVKARLSIEQDGEPQIFRDAATAIGDLAATLQTIQSAGATAFAPLLAQLDQVIAKANDAAAALQRLNQP
ncbi:MAG TPA: hypothetical protein VH394_16875 [Thermoanaerobaculia bacterium]|jgi:hypothetical protein|nr:hypothetical protein [Thermoanaerobaculia bacterium]